MTNRETLIGARFWSRVLFDVTFKFQDNFTKPKILAFSNNIIKVKLANFGQPKLAEIRLVESVIKN